MMIKFDVDINITLGRAVQIRHLKHGCAGTVSGIYAREFSGII
jgi:hypothetical protein